MGGSFTNIGGQPRAGLARLDPDGTLDSSFDPNPNSVIFTIAVQSDGKILVGGNFSYICGEARDYLARLNSNGTLDNEFNPDPNKWVISISIQLGGINWTLLGIANRISGGWQMTDLSLSFH